MTMQEPLNELLAHLRKAIDDDDGSPADQEEIARLAGEVDRRLNEKDDEGIVDELRDEITKFEASHPSLAAAIGRAADALSALGL
jgi:hypothetical protein